MGTARAVLILRRVATVVAVAALALGAAPARASAPPDAQAAATEDDFARRIAGERVARGLPGLATAADLVEVARSHAREMARQNRLHHNPALQEQVQGWQTLGENVGRGGDAAGIHDAFMASDIHRREILHPGFSELGVGVALSPSGIWVVEVFRQPSAPAPRPAPDPAPAPDQPPEITVPAPAPPPPVASVPAATVPVATVPFAAVPAPAVPVAGPAVPTTLPTVEVVAPPAELAAATTGVLDPPALPALPPAGALAAWLLVMVVAAQALAVRHMLAPAPHHRRR